jgi:hypothetical protein
MLERMSPTKTRSFARLMTCLCLALGLLACEREVYTSWNCSSAAEAKIPMVLRKAQMEFKDAKFNYCGSLGSQSYFDIKCPALTEQSNTIFTPASGLLVNAGQEYQCSAL